MVASRASASRSPWLCGLLAVLGLALGCARDVETTLPQEPRAPVEARAAVDRAVATTGDLITYRVTVDHDASYEVDIPEAGAEIAGFRIVDLGREEPRAQKGRVLDERWYQLRADLVGSYVLPSVLVGFRKTVPEGETPGEWETLSTSQIFVEVESVLPADGAAEDIRDLKPLRRIRRRLPWAWIAAGAIGVVLLASAVWLYLRRRARRVEAVPPIPAHELAFRALDALRGTDFDDPEGVRRFYFGISEVVRAYVEGRFGLNATDLTTEEIFALLPGLEEVEAEQNSELRRFLADTDQVKFAHREPSTVEIETTYERALSFVEATRSAAEELDQEAA